MVRTTYRVEAENDTSGHRIQKSCRTYADAKRIAFALRMGGYPHPLITKVEVAA